MTAKTQRYISWSMLTLVLIVSFIGLRIQYETVYLHIPVYIYIMLTAATGIFMAWRFHRNKKEMTSSRYVSESLAAIGFVILACFLVIPAGTAALNYYLPHRGEPYQWDCTITGKETNYTRGVPYHYIIFTPANGADTFRLKVSSHDYKQMRTSHCYHLTIRNGALSYPIIESISR